MHPSPGPGPQARLFGKNIVITEREERKTSLRFSPRPHPNCRLCSLGLKRTLGFRRGPVPSASFVFLFCAELSVKISMGSQ